MKRRPIHPGEILLHEFLEPLAMTQAELARRLEISYPRVSEIVHGRRPVTTDTALRLGTLFGTGPEVWLNLQQAVDLWDVQRSAETARALKRIERVKQTA
jgi:addiction module HigA family antidote